MSTDPKSVNEELEALLDNQKASIKVVGVGGAGGNTLNRLTDIGVIGAETIALNTDAQDLLNTNTDQKILIGKEKTKGLGAGSDPSVGEDSARESEREIKKSIEGADMVFITAGMGGGTGTGAAPVVADLAQRGEALTVGVVTTPFTMEGARRIGNAEIGLQNMRKHVDTLIVIPNDKLLELAPDLPLHQAFKVADEILTNAVKGITELVTRAGLVNLDFADIKTVMGDGGLALIGTGESDSENRASESVEKALANPLLDVEIEGARGALINVEGGEDMTLQEARSVVQNVSEKLDEDAKVIWGAQVDESRKGTMKIMVVVTGVADDELDAPSHREKKRKEVEDELGIEFVE
jgi:cell division protein FtsZ